MGAVTVNRIIYIAVAGALMVIAGGYLGWSGFAHIIRNSIHKDLSLREGSLGHDIWISLPVAYKFSVYLFNVTNPEEVQRGEKPILQEVGPYIYNVKKRRETYTHLQGGFISYYNRDEYSYAEKDENNKPLTDQITFLNVGLMGAATLVERIFPFGLSLLNEAIPFLFPNSTNMFITASAKEILFDGVMIHCNYTRGSAMPICNALKARAPPTIVRDEETKHYSFAMFRHKNNTLQGPFKIRDGVRNFQELGKMIEVKNKTSLPFWPKNSSCSKIRGTDSTVFPPILDKDDIYIYVPDVCLSLSASFDSESYYNGSIAYYHYKGSERNFASVEEVPENSCKCNQPDEQHPNPYCYKKGAFEAFECQGSPIIFSEPHFHRADPSYLNFVDGLKPDPEKHLTYVSIEPMAGVPISGRKRIQMNIHLRRIKGITLLKSVPEGIFPIGWVEEGADLHKEGFEELLRLYRIVNVLNVIRWIVVVFGIVFLISALFLFLSMKHLLCFPDNRVESSEYGRNGEPHKLSTLSTPKDGVQTVSSIYPVIGTKAEVNPNLPPGTS